MAATFADWLCSRSPAQLTTLLTHRPEGSLPPAPTNLLELADRLAHPSTVAAALRRLPTPAIQVVEVLQLLEPDGGDPAALADWLGRPTDDADLAAALDRLADAGLAWFDPGAGVLRMVEPCYRAFSAPLGLGLPAATLLTRYPVEQLRPIARALGLPASGRAKQLVTSISTALADPGQIQRILDNAEPAVRAELLRLDQAGPEPSHAHGWYTSPRLASELVWAAQHGLVLTDPWGSHQLPREVGLALRGPDWRAPFSPHHPTVPLSTVAPEIVSNEAGAVSGIALQSLDAVLDTVAETPPVMLKSGGVGVKELRRLAKATQLTTPVVRLWLEVAYEAELLTVVPDRSGGGELLPSARYDQWADHAPADRLAALLPAWLALPASPMLDPDVIGEKPPPALIRDHRGPVAALARHLLLTFLGTLPSGQAVRDPQALTEPVRWLAPLRLPPDPMTTELIAAAWREASHLGAVAHGAATVLVAPLHAGSPAELADAYRELLPPTSTEAVFQADLTAVVPGVPDPELARLLDDAADRESGGGATTWRFTAGSVRRALDTGHQPALLLDQLTGRAVGNALPQPLTYLVHDIARRHGKIRVREASSVLRVEDEALAAELAGAKALKALRLTTIAPGVLTAAAPPAEVLAALRTAGYAPVGESADGVPQFGRPPQRRAPEPRRGQPPHPLPGPREPESPESLARRLLAAPLPTSAPRPRSPGASAARGRRPDLSSRLASAANHLTKAERRLLETALTTGDPVTISYTDAQGRTSMRVIDSAELDGGHLFAWCHLREDERMFALARIEAVEPAPYGLFEDADSD
ncbi:helicase-associated domain-containing protein [Natronosporangium hydrolyticum]|uniref:Helicase-associated domain-containing protein n=1 Tax=Natronosporangium hydrolyticum TaxID=2811111 RepID=A0A895YJW5_9ACTN|nr:helicase-associated domain-containing protein [Natronosporangium hydrolyticum]QSB15633.1 helicase-associated domain-containing protein [Natronosporangium hydrolyticum]